MRHPITTLVTQEARHILVLLQGAHFEVVHTQTGALLASTVAAGTKPSGCRRIAERHEGEETITAASLSGDGALLATTADDKLVKVWDTNAWTCQWTRRTGKRPTAVTFTNDAASVVLADKFGDVFQSALFLYDIFECSFFPSLAIRLAPWRPQVSTTSGRSSGTCP